MFLPEIASAHKSPRVGFTASTLVVPVLVALIFGLFCYAFQMVHDPYGDAVHFEDKLNNVGVNTETAWNYLSDFSLDPWAGEKTVLAVITLISSGLLVSQGKAFMLVGLVCGVVFMFMWVWHLRNYVADKSTRVALSLAVFLSPIVLNFLGHAEIYAPSLVIGLVWSMALLRHTRLPKWTGLLTVVVLTVIAIKLHPIAILLLPSLLLGLIRSLEMEKGWSVISWKNVSLFLLLPTFFAGLLLYFFVFKDHVDDRSLETVAMQFDHLFLPLFSPDPPLHRYNLFSFSHLSDFLNVIIMWSPGVIVLAIVGMFSQNFRAILKSREAIILAVPLILYVGLLFAVNPLLSMPMDWDLFMLPTPFFLVLTSFVVSQSETYRFYLALPTALALTVFVGASAVALHLSKASISLRLESIAIHVHRSYYEWTTKIIDRSYSLVEYQESDYQARRNKLINELRKDAVLGLDKEFSELLRRQAKYMYQKRGELQEAQLLLNDAFEYHPVGNNNNLTMVELQFLLGNYTAAYEYSKKLVESNFPSEEKALRIVIHCALEANQYQDAKFYSESYLYKWEDPAIREVERRLIRNDRVELLSSLFQQSH